MLSISSVCLRPRSSSRENAFKNICTSIINSHVRKSCLELSEQSTLHYTKLVMTASAVMQALAWGALGKILVYTKYILRCLEYFKWVFFELLIFVYEGQLDSIGTLLGWVHIANILSKYQDQCFCHSFRGTMVDKSTSIYRFWSFSCMIMHDHAWFRVIMRDHAWITVNHRESPVMHVWSGFWIWWDVVYGF